MRQHLFITILLFGLLLVATNAEAADNEKDDTTTRRRIKHGKNSSSSSSKASKVSKYSKASSKGSKSSSSSSSSDDIPRYCKPSEQRKCCVNGNRALCIIDNGCSIDNCGRCEKELFKQCCLETGDTLAFCVTDLNCDVTKCGGNGGKKKKNKDKKARMLLVESGTPTGEGNKKIFK